MRAIKTRRLFNLEVVNHLSTKGLLDWVATAHNPAFRMKASSDLHKLRIQPYVIVLRVRTLTLVPMRSVQRRSRSLTLLNE